MSELSAFRVSVADLRRPGSMRDVDVEAPVRGIGNGAAEVPANMPVQARLHLERVSDGVVVRGEIAAQWDGQCSRCLTAVGAEMRVHVDELFEEEPIEGETYRLDHALLDLEPMVRDVLTLDLPLAPVCDAACQGLCPACGIDRNQASCDCSTDEPDPRWAALRSLEL
jgi:uncharacterized protein